MLEGASRVLSRHYPEMAERDNAVPELREMARYGRTETEDSVKKGLTNMIKQGKFKEKGSFFIPINDNED